MSEREGKSPCPLCRAHAAYDTGRKQWAKRPAGRYPPKEYLLEVWRCLECRKDFLLSRGTPESRPVTSNAHEGGNSIAATPAKGQRDDELIGHPCAVLGALPMEGEAE